MKITLTESKFIDEFNKVRSNYFSYETLQALYKYYDEFDGIAEIEFDPIAISCEWEEYDNWEEVKDNYNINSSEELRELTTVLHTEDLPCKIIVQQY